MANVLEKYNSESFIVIVCSTDCAWDAGQIDGALVAALANCGVGKDRLKGSQDWREPYALVGIPQLGGLDVLNPTGSTRASIVGTFLFDVPNKRYSPSVDSVLQVGG